MKDGSPLLRVLLDGTPFLDRPTGVGVFLNEVARRLVRRPDIEVGAYGLTLLGYGEMKRRVPMGVHPFDLPIPAPYVRKRWTVTDSPPIEWWTGAVDVVHGPNFLVPPTYRAAEVVTVHDLTCLRFPEMCTADTLAYPAYIQRAADRGAWIHTVSSFVADEVRDAFRVDPDRVIAIPNGVVSNAPGDAAQGRALAGGHPYVLALGTVEPRKDYPLLVRAFDALVPQHPGLRLVIAGGDGWGAEALDDALTKVTHRDAIVRVGYVEDAARVALLAGAELLAYPSRYEGFGLPPMEAMAAGLPVVTTRAGAIPEVVGDAAELVDLDDEAGLASAMQRVLTDSDRRAELIRLGRANLERFSWDRTTEELVGLYRRAAAERPAPPSTSSPLARWADRRPAMMKLSGPPGRQGGDAADPAVVRVVVLDYNGGAFVLRCVEALRRTEVPAGLTLEIVVIDNRSSDGSADAIEAAFDDVVVLRNTANDGFPANNLGLWDLDGLRAVGLINSDAFVEPGWLAPLLECLDADEGRGAACPRILLDARFVDVTVSSPTFSPGGSDERRLGVRVLGLRVGGEDVWAGTRVGLGDFGREHGPEGIFQWTGERTLLRVPVAADATSASLLLAAPTDRSVTVTLTCGASIVEVDLAGAPVWVDVPLASERYDLVNNAGSIVFDDGYGADRGFLEPDGPAFDEPTDVFAFCGGAVLFRPAFLRDVGVLDRRFFLYYEDTDLSWRGRSRGWTYRYVPASRVRHLHAASTVEGSTFSTYFNERNRLLMLMKNAPAAMVVDALAGTGQVISTDLRKVATRVARRRRFDQLDRSHLRHAWMRSRTVGGFLRHLPFMARRRRQIGRERTVSEADLLAGLTPRRVPTESR